MSRTPSKRSTEAQVAYLTFLHRETGERHHHYEEEMKQYRLMQAGDPEAVEESARMMSGNLHGHMVDDAVRNVKYLFVANITLATRFAIEGGMDAETAYNISDLYIGRMDAQTSVQAVLDVHREMYAYFTGQMARIKKEKVISRWVTQCIEYIDLHLHEKITVEDLAQHTGLSPSYLSTLFKKETGQAVSEYIPGKRIEVAKNMLLNSDYSSSEIAHFLNFSSQSHFIRVFRDKEGMTPKEYRDLHYGKGIRAASAGKENIADQQTGGSL